MTTWHWVRHGPTHEKSFVGWRDVPADLSDTAQIARLSAHLPSDALLISSDLVRASATADVLAASGRNRLRHEADLRELHFGEWDGLGWKAVAERDPVLSRTYWESPGDTAPPGGESWNAAAARVTASVDRLTQAHPGQHIIAVAHFGTILTQVQRALGGDAVKAMGHKIDNLSVTTLVHASGGWQAEQINHLP
ncbi:histidine phosphatase family protein [Sulfitobacter sp. TSTF-M16]|uniref:Histidine phosphatase family protein n=1 Tax=Sulfitobacter aestuariivivens TaxID=2766981 RepID=A0A927HGC7_9RHOB|nr:histidine phosphatase family protein [Sulfitobacter aestuariivivens]MBD3665831.1 histidine phosphatase family protein [Sulfitobacter aestuariivivens]